MKKYTVICLFLLSIFESSAQCYQAIKTNQADTQGCTIALQTDGTLWSWGFNNFGVLGIGSSLSSFIYSPKTQIGTSTDWSSKFSVNGHVLALKNDGTLWAWGANQNGQCGNGQSGQNVFLTAPVQVGTDTWMEVTAGNNYSLGIKTDGTLWAWGSNVNGQFGNGSYISSTVPIQIGTNADWLKIFSTHRTSFAIKNNGSLWSWGDSFYGLLGRSTGAINSPHQVGTSTNWVSVEPTIQYVSAIKSDGTLWTWGRTSGNGYIGYYGNGLTDANIYENNPTQIGTDTDWQAISVSQFGSLAIKNNGTLWAWGWNQYGELGDGTAISRYTPIQLGSENNWTSLSTYYIYINAYAIKNNSLYEWGGLGPIGPLSLSTPALFEAECTLSSNSYNSISVVKSYPNPTNDFVTINFTEPLSEIIEVTISNGMGQQISVSKVIQSNNFECTVDVRDLSTGIYYLRIKSGTTNYATKIVKQ